MICNRCLSDKPQDDFYPKDRTCRECRKRLVRENRANRAEQYAAYERKRYQEQPARRDINKAYVKTPAGAAAVKKAKQKWRSQNPEKRAAHVILAAAINRGDIQRPDCCQDCGAKRRVEGHHADYTKPLAVEWLCHPCHMKRHF